MIAQKLPKQTPREERAAYNAATLRDGDTCQRCRRDCGPIARDHRQNRSQGGLTVLSNLQLLGLRCHQWATEHPREALAEGWAVPGWADPAQWPARRWVSTKHGTVRLAWVLYGNDGSVVEITDDEAHGRRKGGAE